MFKRYLGDVEEEKFKVIIKVINRYDFDQTDLDSDHVPENKEIANGSSGGPLLNMSGEVIGITTSGFGEANLNFAINLDKLRIDQFL